jgi:hypothetical protein
MPARFLILLAAIVFGSGCSRRAGDDSSAAGMAHLKDEVLALARARDVFALRRRLELIEADDVPEILYGRSVVRHAFNDLAGSNEAIERVRKRGGLSDSLLFKLAALEVTNLLRLSRYREGLAVADQALAAPPPAADSAEVADLGNIRKILSALAHVPPQEVVRLDSATIPLDRGRVPVVVEGRRRDYIFDTGANLSTLSRSEARELGLTIVPAGIDVGSSTDLRNTADLAVADQVIIGGLELRHVVFLVFEDRLLTFPGVTIRGIIGFPVIEAMGEVRLRPSGEIIVPGRSTVPRLGNLALDGHTPLTTIEWRGDTLVCRLDTGANKTDIYEPFYRRYRGWVDSAGRADSTTSGGVGGLRTLPVRALTDLVIGVGDTIHRLAEVPVITRSITAREADNYLYCNLGHDVFDAFAEYVINFREMSFVLR